MQPALTTTASLTTSEFIDRCTDLLVPITESLSYFSVPPIEEKESERLVRDPTGAFPPRLLQYIPNLRLILVPYLKQASEQGNGQPQHVIAFEPPSEASKSLSSFVTAKGENYLFLAVRDEGLFDAHVLLYTELADRIIAVASKEVAEPFYRVINDELSNGARGELYEGAWQLKKELLKRQGDGAESADLLADYRRQALSDTLTLYLHGLCCDIDVDGGPKQLPSRRIRKRLELLRDLLPPPDGIALFPEELPPV